MTTDGQGEIDDDKPLEQSTEGLADKAKYGRAQPRGQIEGDWSTTEAHYMTTGCQGEIEDDLR
jgi:hypothetical protein